MWKIFSNMWMINSSSLENNFVVDFVEVFGFIKIIRESSKL